MSRTKHHDSEHPRYYVRDADPADVADIIEMKLRSWRETYSHVRDEKFFQQAEASAPDQIAFWRAKIAQGNKLWLAEDLHGQIVGIAAAAPANAENAEAEPTEPHYQLRLIYVLKSAQGSGVADALLDNALGHAPASLSVIADNARARAFFTRHGFRNHGEPKTPESGAWADIPEQLMVRGEQEN